MDIAKDLEVPTGEAGEIIVSGWHVNTGQVGLVGVRGVASWSSVGEGCGHVGLVWVMGVATLV